MWKKQSKRKKFEASPKFQEPSYDATGLFG